jgi:hypothetical protein
MDEKPIDSYHVVKPRERTLVNILVLETRICSDTVTQSETTLTLLGSLDGFFVPDPLYKLNHCHSQSDVKLRPRLRHCLGICMSFQIWSVAGSGVDMDDGIGPCGRCGPGKKGLDQCFQGEGCRAGTTRCTPSADCSVKPRLSVC